LEKDEKWMRSTDDCKTRLRPRDEGQQAGALELFRADTEMSDDLIRDSLRKTSPVETLRQCRDVIILSGSKDEASAGVQDEL
jgi:hypothetical protein